MLRTVAFPYSNYMVDMESMIGVGEFELAIWDYVSYPSFKFIGIYLAKLLL